MPAASRPHVNMMRASQRRAESDQQQVRRHFEQGVAQKKQTAAQTVDRGTEAQILVHLQGGKADVDAVHVGDAIAESKQRQEPPGLLANRRAPDLFVACTGG